MEKILCDCCIEVVCFSVGLAVCKLKLQRQFFVFLFQKRTKKEERMKVGVITSDLTSNDKNLNENFELSTQKEEENNNLNLITNETFIFQGQIGEKTIETKATVGDNYAVLAGLLLAFCISNLLSISSSDFNSKINFNCYVLFTTIATSFGFICVLSFTMLSGKIRRLLGRSLYLFGDAQEFSEQLIQIHGNKKWETLKQAYYYPRPISETRFPARQWYYNCKDALIALPTEVETVPTRSSTTPFYTPYLIQGYSITTFYLLCLSFIIAMCFKIYDSVNSQLAIVCFILLGVGIILPILIGHLNNSLYDLN